jgi:hypothetical protein
VYEIVDSLSEEAIRRLLEENLIEAAITDEDFAYTVQYQTRSFIHQAETKAELANAKQQQVLALWHHKQTKA